MKTRTKPNRTWRTPRSRIQTALGHEASAAGEPALVAPQRGPSELALDHLKDRLLQPILAASDPALAESLRWAAREAASLAWTTSVPLLVFPELLSEKLHQARLQSSHQQTIWERSGRPLSEAV